ncbi:hypothetical protein CRX54_09025 [Klebsiella oxytoca]|nr:hypothetical protein CRX54_09025 [Klebsiella oxytoca]
MIKSLSIRAILLTILNQGSAQNPHVLRVRSGSSALSVFKLPAPITPTGIGSKVRHACDSLVGVRRTLPVSIMFCSPHGATPAISSAGAGGGPYRE